MKVFKGHTSKNDPQASILAEQPRVRPGLLLAGRTTRVPTGRAKCEKGQWMAHWEYVVWAGSSPVGLVAIWRYAPRAFLMLVGGLTKDPQRSKQCAEMLRLQRKDASNIQSYLVDPPAQQPGQLPQSAVRPTQTSLRP
jgi:hypothetical protein